MKKIGYAFGLAILMAALLLGSAGCAANPLMASPAQAETDVGKLHREVVLLNLINGLELSADQMRFVLEKAKEAEELREDFKERAQENVGETVEVLSELREVLMRGEDIPSSLRERVHQVQGANKALKQEFEEEMAGLALEVKEVLGDHQLYALEHFVPCTIPPEGELRIGQAEGTTHIEKALERIREMPAPMFERRKERMAQRALELGKRHLPKGFILDEEEEKDRIISIFEQARAMSDVEFELEKANLAQQLKSRYELPKLPLDVSVKIERFLLDPLIIPLLEEKLAIGE